MRKLINIHLSLLLIFVLSCENSVPVPEDTFTQRSVKSLSAQEIPNVIAQLNKTLNYRDEIKTSSNSGINTASFGEIEMDNIIEVIDTLSNANYTFMVNDGDTNPHTFSNLVIKKHASGAFDTPYLLEYEVDSTSMSEFIRSEFSMDNFTGRVYKRYLSNISYNGGNQANLENRSNTNSPGPCDLVTTYTNGNTGTGLTDSNDGPDSPAPSNEGGSSDDDGCFTYFEYFFVERICHRFKYDGQSPDRYCRNVFVRTEVTQCPGDFGPHTSIEDDCPSNLDDEIGIIISDAEMRILIFEDLLRNDPTALLEIDCDQLPNWQSLIQHTPPESVINKIETLDANYTSILTGDWDIQYIKEAKGPVVNLDYFPVKISQLPINPITGETFSPTDFLNYVRKNLDSFFEGNSTGFRKYNNYQEDIWNSSNYLGAIMRFNIYVNAIVTQNGSVICSYQDSSKWIFTTIESPKDWNHPVSGNREFGISQNQDGTYTFYTRGTDRVAERLDNFIGNLPISQSAFEGADALWTQFQENLQEFVNSPQNGGQAIKGAPVISRPDWSKVKDVLEGRRPISDLGC